MFTLFYFFNLFISFILLILFILFIYFIYLFCCHPLLVPLWLQSSMILHNRQCARNKATIDFGYFWDNTKIVMNREKWISPAKSPHNILTRSAFRFWCYISNRADPFLDSDWDSLKLTRSTFFFLITLFEYLIHG